MILLVIMVEREEMMVKELGSIMIHHLVFSLF